MEYTTYKISEIGNVITGKTPPTKIKEFFSETPDKYLFITPRDMNIESKYIYCTERYLTDYVTDKFKNIIIDEKSICVSCIGTVGKVFIPSQLSITNQQINSITNIKSFCDYNYLYYYLKCNYKKIQAVAGGTTMPIVNKSSFEDIEVELPDVIYQKKVSKILGTIDSKIKINNDLNANIYNMMINLFNNYIDNLETYDESTLSEIASYKNGLAMQKFRPINEEGLPVIKIKEMNSGISSDTERCRTDIPSDVTINDGDVLFAWSGTLCMNIWCGGKAGLNQHIFKVTSEKYPKWFYYFWTLKYLNSFIEIAAGKATTMGHIKREELDKAIVKIPSNESIKKMGNIFEPLFKEYINNNIENRQLTELRDSLLPKLINGEIDLDNIEV